MSHLPEVQLHEWKSGQPISASVLNRDFGTLRDLIDYAADLAVTPDTAGTEALQRVTLAEDRIAALEWRNEATARELGEKEYTPLATFGAFVLHVNTLTDPLAQAAAELRAEVQRRTVADAAFAGRLTEVEARPAPPPSPTIQQFRQLQAELAEARAEVEVAHATVRELRRGFLSFTDQMLEQVAILGRAAGIQYVELQQRMDAFAASTAADDVAEMRKELAQAHRLIADTDRKEELHKTFTPRSAFAFMLQRLERLEKRLP